MTFNSVVFGVFLLVVFAVYWMSPVRLRNPVLLVASYFFYGWWDWRFLSLLGISTMVDYTIGRRLGHTDKQGSRLRLLLLSVTVNLGILAAFKYAGFFIESLSALTESLGFGELNPAFDIVLPVGISFYTFQTMSYTFDVYRRRIAPTRNLVDFATYVAFFPQLVAGPIERARHLLPQISNRARPLPRGDALISALALMLLGLFKKVVIADGIAGVADDVFASPGDYSWLGAAAGVLAFGIQIYGDFSGYTDIARGAGRLFGIDLVVNFRQPYLARNITEFWTRWHISLSNWLRDYLYIPLGGNRGSRLQTLRNLMITMLLGGLWHGAAWGFVLWGGLHGVYLVVHRLLAGGRVSEAPLAARDLPAILFTFAIVNLAWIFFRADGLGDAFLVLGRLAGLQAGSTPAADLALVGVLGTVVLGIDLAARQVAEPIRTLRRAPLLAGAVGAAALAAIVVFSGGTPEPFIYFQF